MHLVHKSVMVLEMGVTHPIRMGCPVNYRDVSLTFPSQLRPGLIFRSGDPTFTTSLQDLGHPLTIINLRMEPASYAFPGVQQIHCPIPNRIEKYHAGQPEVRTWLAMVIQAIADAPTPILVHCKSGRDRTGIVLAILLRILLSPASDRQIIEEFLLSEGAVEDDIRVTLREVHGKCPETDGDAWIQEYFRKFRVPVKELRKKFCRHICNSNV